MALADADLAAISTLHGFAQRILGEHPAQSGLPPRIGVLDEVSSSLEREKRWERFVDALHDDPANEELLVRAALLEITLEPSYEGQRSLKASPSAWARAGIASTVAADPCTRRCHRSTSPVRPRGRRARVGTGPLHRPPPMASTCHLVENLLPSMRPSPTGRSRTPSSEPSVPTSRGVPATSAGPRRGAARSTPPAPWCARSTTRATDRRRGAATRCSPAWSPRRRDLRAAAEPDDPRAASSSTTCSCSPAGCCAPARRRAPRCTSATPTCCSTSSRTPTPSRSSWRCSSPPRRSHRTPPGVARGRGPRPAGCSSSATPSSRSTGSAGPTSTLFLRARDRFGSDGALQPHHQLPHRARRHRLAQRGVLRAHGRGATGHAAGLRAAARPSSPVARRRPPPGAARRSTSGRGSGRRRPSRRGGRRRRGHRLDPPCSAPVAGPGARLACPMSRC
jgi:hypothetical protein